MIGATFTVLLDREFLARYLQDHGAGNAMQDYEFLSGMRLSGLAEVTPEQLKEIATAAWNYFPGDVTQQYLEDYSSVEMLRNHAEVFTENMIMHVADEILDQCCRTVFDF